MQRRQFLRNPDAQMSIFDRVNDRSLNLFFFFFKIVFKPSFPARAHKFRQHEASFPTEQMAIKQPINPIKTNEAVITCVIRRFPLTLYSKRDLFLRQTTLSLSLAFNLESEGRGTFSQPRRKKRERKKGKQHVWLRAASPDLLQMLRVFNTELTLRWVHFQTEVAAFLEKDQGISEWTGCGSVSVGLSFMRSV